MKTLKKRNEKKLVTDFAILKPKELLQIRGGDEQSQGDPTQKDSEID